MSREDKVTGVRLANALQALDVRFILGGQSTGETLHQQPARLIAALAGSNESRLRLSLIPLFLEHPEFAVHVRTVARRLDSSACLTLQCYYTAAVWLAKLHQPSPALPDYFSRVLSLRPGDDPTENLGELAERQRKLSGSQVNWLGTYLHAAAVWQKGLRLKGV